MSAYTKSINHQSDVLGFFIHLLHDRKLNFHPDTPFNDYIHYDTNQLSFTQEECAAYEKVMDDCQNWCEDNEVDIYQLALDSLLFSAFLEGYQKITDRVAMKNFLKEYMDEDYPIDSVVALHTYQNCYYIEELEQNNKPIYQFILENTEPSSDNLRDMEIILFDWMDKEGLVAFERLYPEKIESRKDIVQFFSYLHLDRQVAFHPDDSFKGYVNGQTRQKTFTPEECETFDRLMAASHAWCEKNNTDIYYLGMDLIDFLDSHHTYTDAKTMLWLRRELPDDIPLGHIVRLHSYEDDIWIREVDHNGVSLFQCRTNKGQDMTCTSLRSLEVELYDANADRYLQNRQARKR